MIRVASEKRKWHMGREIPIAMIIAVTCQTIGIIIVGAVWTTGITRDVKNIAEEQSRQRNDISEMRTEIKDLKQSILNGATPTAVNAARIEVISQQVNSLQSQLQALRR